MRRTLGALGGAFVAAMLAFTWALFLVDAFVDGTDSPAPGLIVLAVGVVAFVVAYRGRTGREAIGRGLAAAGILSIAGPALLVAIRLAGIARPAAGISTNLEGWGVLVPAYLAGDVLWGVIVILLGRRATRGAAKVAV